MTDELIRQMRADLARQIVRGDFVVRATEITMLEDEIERRGLTERYAECLMEAVGLTPAGDIMCVVGFFDAWRLLRATPEARARAFLAAVEPSS